MGKIFKINWQSNTLIVRFFLTFLIYNCGSNSFAIDSSAQEIAPESSSPIHSIQTSHNSKWMVVTANHYATLAAEKIIAQGGNAIDAAITAQMILGLVEPQSSGLGGGGFLVYWDNKNKTLTTFDGRETAPAKVDSNYFLTSNASTMSFYDAVIGGYAVGTPGLLHMLNNAHQRFGQTPWKELFQPAITLAREGFTISPRLHLLLNQLKSSPKGASNPSLQKYFFESNGLPKSSGTLLKNPSYAKTLTHIANDGISVFYSGYIAKNIVNAVNSDQNKQGFLSLEDMRNYRSIERPALCKFIGEYELCGAPPPTSGAFTVISIISMMQEINENSTSQYNPIIFYHRFIEASKLAFADRNQYLADPDFINIPLKQLLDDKYLKKRALQIPLLKASTEKAIAGKVTDPSGFINSNSFELPSTTHLSIIDQQGNIVSMTSSIETAFGSRILVDGFLLNNQLTDFSFSPNDTSTTKIANRIEPNKRPRSSMAPMIIFNKDKQAVLVVGSPGGSAIVNYVAQTILQNLYFGISLDKAITNIHVVNLNQETQIETNHEDTNSLSIGLEKLGHSLIVNNQSSGIHAIRIKKSELSSDFFGVADPRREGTAAGR